MPEPQYHTLDDLTLVTGRTVEPKPEETASIRRLFDALASRGFGSCNATMMVEVQVPIPNAETGGLVDHNVGAWLAVPTGEFTLFFNDGNQRTSLCGTLADLERYITAFMPPLGGDILAIAAVRNAHLPGSEARMNRQIEMAHRMGVFNYPRATTATVDSPVDPIAARSQEER